MAIADQVITDEYAIYNGDCIEVLREFPDESIHLTIYSPPFCGLYNYSSSARDLSNCDTYEQFHEHYRYVVEQIARVTMPGRIVVIHCMDIPIPGQRDGYYDLPGNIVRDHERYGFMYFGRISIWKEPFRVALRTRQRSLMHRQLVKDSTQCTVAAGDALLVFRKRGENKVPVTHKTGFTEYAGEREVPDEFLKTRGERSQEKNRYSQWVWRQYASCVWDDIRPNRVLPYKEAKDPEDERHVHPLQLDVIERCLELWSNPGENVLTPFMGVGSEVYGAVMNGRRGIGIELKRTYFKQARKHLANAKSGKQTELLGSLFDDNEEDHAELDIARHCEWGGNAVPVAKVVK